MSINGVRDDARAVRHRSWPALRLWPALFAVAGALILTGCGGAESASGGLAAPQSADQEAAGRSAADGSGAADTATSLAAKDGERQGEGSQPQINVQPEDRAIVYTAEMTVRAKDVAAAAEKAKQLAIAAGGYVADERSDSFDGGGSRATLILKVPPDRYPTVIGQFGRDLGKRENLHQGTEDVTEEVADVAARVKSAEAALAQFRTLLTKAEKIGEVLEIEREISQRTADLEALQARQKALAARTSMATITLNLIGPAAAPPDDDDEPDGFLGGLATGWKALVAAVKIGLTILGVLLPWLVVFILLALVLRLLLRRLRPRPAAASPPPAPATPGPPFPGAPPQDPVGAAATPTATAATAPPHTSTSNPTTSHTVTSRTAPPQ
ncbi:DUF4349 domain-containing protein [Thermopolyspora sp. NPDC052614]|uniref:DUF4349 domain-containing protein n=1 Tax=Thermopolyspora sp. NPDC052614 TaxID=3155682 RepID=UPI00341601A8